MLLSEYKSMTVQFEFFTHFGVVGHKGQGRETKCLLPESGCGPFTDITLSGRPLVAGECKEVYTGGLAQP